MEVIRVFDYINYREFLRDFFQQEKKKSDGVTPKAVLYAMGLSSSGFISNVLAGRKNLSPIQVNRLAQAIELESIETEYLEVLVLFNQAKDVNEKNEFFEKLSHLQGADLEVISEERLSIFAKWYYPAVHEILSFFPFNGSYAQLARQVEPEISPVEAREAIEALEMMGFIQMDERGFYHQVDDSVTTGVELQNRHLLLFQMWTSDLAKRALQDIPQDERDISCLTLSLSDKGFDRIKREIQHFRRKIARIALDDVDLKRTYQMNFHFFPMSRKRK